MWQQAAHTPNQLSSPSCSTRAIQRSPTLNNKWRVFWKNSGEWTISREQERGQVREIKWQPWDSKQGRNIRHPWPPFGTCSSITCTANHDNSADISERELFGYYLRIHIYMYLCVSLLSVCRYAKKTFSFICKLLVVLMQTSNQSQWTLMKINISRESIRWGCWGVALGVWGWGRDVSVCVCVGGGGERDTGCCFMVVVPDCTQVKLHGLILQWIIVGTSFSGSSLEHPSADHLWIILQQIIFGSSFISGSIIFGAVDHVWIILQWIIFGSSFSVSCLDHPSADQT